MFKNPSTPLKVGTEILGILKIEEIG